MTGGIKYLIMGMLAVTAAFSAPASAWEPSQPVELVVAAANGGAAERMAHLIQDIVTRHKLLPVPMVVVHKAGGAGAEGFLDLKAAQGDPHKILLAQSNLVTTPLATGLPFNWRELTPVAMLALDRFVLWTNADAPYTNLQEYIDATKVAGPGKMKMGGSGARQEAHLITLALEKATDIKFSYVPFNGSGEVVVQLLAKYLDSSVNNPAQMLTDWRAGSVRPLCVFDDRRMPYKTRMTFTQAWNDIPVCGEAGRSFIWHIFACQNLAYQALRGIMMAPGVSAGQLAYYVALFTQIRATPEWEAYMELGALAPTFMVGAEFNAWLAAAEVSYRVLMEEAGFLAQSQ